MASNMIRSWHLELPRILQSDVDGVFIGPMDLSCALDEHGLGTNGHKTQQAISRIAALAQYWGKVVGIYVSDRSSTEPLSEQGNVFAKACKSHSSQLYLRNWHDTF